MNENVLFAEIIPEQSLFLASAEQHNNQPAQQNDRKRHHRYFRYHERREKLPDEPDYPAGELHRGRDSRHHGRYQGDADGVARHRSGEADGHGRIRRIGQSGRKEAEKSDRGPQGV